MVLEQESLTALYGIQFFLLFIMGFSLTIAISMVLMWFGFRKYMKQLDEMLRTMQLKLIIDDKPAETKAEKSKSSYPRLQTLGLPR